MFDKDLKKIGFYGGTFDPIHFGHLNLAIEAFEQFKLDEIWFCPTYKNPLKLHLSLADKSHRLSMLESALQDIPHFKILPIEIEHNQPTYTVDTLRRLMSPEFNLLPEQLFLILGVDAFTHFSEWKEPNEIIKMAKLLVGNRITYDYVKLKDLMQRWSLSDNSIFSNKIFEISSTEIRHRLKNRLYCGHLIPEKVIHYIYEHQLYYD